jgi:hypothetical protein
MKPFRLLNHFNVKVAPILLILSCQVLVSNLAPMATDAWGRSTLIAASEPNDFRWDIAEHFVFDWDSVEISATATKGGDPNPNWRTLTISARLGMLLPDGLGELVGIDVNDPGIIELLDQSGAVVPSQPIKSITTRSYQQPWILRQVNGSAPNRWIDFVVTCRLSADKDNRLPSSISSLQGFVYLLLADSTISVDIPFDPNAQPVQAAADPNITVTVDPTMPPCPGPLSYVIVSSTPDPWGTRQIVVTRPATAVSLYMYKTWVNLKAHTPALVMCDKWSKCPRELFPLGEYIIVHSGLHNSKNGKGCHPEEWTQSDPSGDLGAMCWGQATNGDGEFDTIRHIIAVHPVELKIPFDLRNIPIPSLQPPGN